MLSAQATPSPLTTHRRSRGWKKSAFPCTHTTHTHSPRARTSKPCISNHHARTHGRGDMRTQRSAHGPITSGGKVDRNVPESTRSTTNRSTCKYAVVNSASRACGVRRVGNTTAPFDHRCHNRPQWCWGHESIQAGCAGTKWVLRVCWVLGGCGVGRVTG